jgi:hypothetical protein
VEFLRKAFALNAALPASAVKARRDHRQVFPTFVLCPNYCTVHINNNCDEHPAPPFSIRQNRGGQDFLNYTMGITPSMALLWTKGRERIALGGAYGFCHEDAAKRLP